MKRLPLNKISKIKFFGQTIIRIYLKVFLNDFLGDFTIENINSVIEKLEIASELHFSQKNR